jgi:hypothetical protein
LRWPPKPPEALKRDTSRGWAVIQWAEPGFAGVPTHPRRPDVPNRSLTFRSGLVHSLGCLAGHDPATSCSTDSRPPFHGHPLACILRTVTVILESGCPPRSTDVRARLGHYLGQSRVERTVGCGRATRNGPSVCKSEEKPSDCIQRRPNSPRFRGNTSRPSADVQGRARGWLQKPLA